jgi:quercetin dioxygenase-like cupin family protein
MLPDRHEDYRGIIEDILPEPIDCVTRIFTKAGAVRGNHRHRETIQWTYVISGRLRIVTDDGEYRRRRDYGPGEMAREDPGIAHAWRALEDTTVLVFTRGPRSGEAYESDTIRLKVPLL